MATCDKLIEVKNLQKYYNSGALHALDGVTVDINHGDVMVVVGPSGSGKSTFLRSLNLLEEPTGGQIIFDGVEITAKKVPNAEGKLVKLNIDEHRQRMGMVFQHFNLFPHKTVLDIMTMAPMKVKGMKMVVLPQAIKNVLPALANEIVTMVKESSICSMLGIADLMFVAKTTCSSTYISLAPYTLAAVIYFCINFPASKAIEAVERRMRRGDMR